MRDLTQVYPTPLGIQVYGGLSSAVVLPPLPALTKPSTVRVRIKTSKLSDSVTLLVYTTTAASYELNSNGLSPGMIPIATFQRTGTEGMWSLYEAVLHNLVSPYRIGISAPNVEFVLKEDIDSRNYFSRHARKSPLSGEEEALMRSLRRYRRL